MINIKMSAFREGADLLLVTRQQSSGGVLGGISATTTPTFSFMSVKKNGAVWVSCGGKVLRLLVLLVWLVLAPCLLLLAGVR